MSDPRIITRDIGTGDTAIRATLEHMKRLARRDAKTPDIKVVVEKIRSEAEPFRDDPIRYRYELARAAFRWVVDNIDYRYDHEHINDHVTVADPMNTEFVMAPKHLVTIGQGDCDDMSTILASLLGAMGFSVQFKVIAHKSRHYSHVYLEGLVPNADGQEVWMPMDPVLGYDGWGWEKPDIIRKDLLKVF